jgi:Tfp pilus assembly protein PilF
LASVQSVNAQAHENHLRGQFSLEKGELKKSIAYFQKAIQEDPNYAPAYAGLANAYISQGETMVWRGRPPPLECFSSSESGCQQRITA